MSEKGKYYEQLVELIEKSIHPNSIVERDVKLPIIDSKSGAISQCDIVITEGKPPREFITIVEVQNRSRKPDANKFRGWVGKLERVGAQRLICVSKKGFTKSVKEEARKRNGSIILIKLDKIPKESLPIDFIPVNGIYKNFTLLKGFNLEFNISDTDLKVYGIHQKKIESLIKNSKLNDEIYSINKNRDISLVSLSSESVKGNDFGLGTNSGVSTFNYDIEKDSLYVKFKGTFIKIGLHNKFKWRIDKTRIPITYLTYDQDSFGTLAWLVQGKLKTKKGLIRFEAPIIKDTEGYRIGKTKSNVPDGIESKMYLGPPMR